MPGGIVQIQSAALNPHLSHMFFRPEEYGVRSKIADNVAVVEGPPIDLRQIETRIRVPFAHPPPQTLVHTDVHGAPAMGAGGRDLHLQPFVSEAPFDEGRRKSV